MTFQRVLETAGFTKVELADLYGASRQTIHSWAAGRGPRPGSLTARMADTVTKALCAAIDKRLLPLAAMDKAARASRIASMKKTLQNLKPAPAR